MKKKKLLPTINDKIVSINSKIEAKKSPMAKTVTAEIFEYLDNLQRQQYEFERDFRRNHKVISLEVWKTEVKGMQPGSYTSPKKS